MVDKKSAFKIYGSYAEQVNALTDSEAGRLFKALVNYRNGEEPKNLSGMEQIAFLFIRQQMDYDCEKYERRCEQNRKNGMKGGRPRKNTQEQSNRTVVEENPNNRPVFEMGETEKQEKKPAKKTNSYPKNFEEFWAVYPRKDEKGVAYAKYAARIKDGYSPEELLQAATAYADQCRRLKTEKQYTKQAKTFLSDKAPFADFLKSEIKQESENDGYGEVDFSKLVEV